MALPPDTAESFVREVDEKLREDQAKEFFQKNGKWIGGLVALILLVAGGYFVWESRQQSQARQDSEAIAAALERVGNGNPKAASDDLAKLQDSSIDTTRASALFTRAAIALQQNDRKTAVDLYKKIADDSGLPDAYRDLATVRAVATEFDTISPDDVIARLKPLAKPGKPYFGTAGELTAMALLKKGDKAGAGQLFARIAADKGVPDSIRSRAVQVAGSLGIDATASMPGGDPAALPAQ
ncbi:tetratricopeptide repeat protein [Sphingomonas jaspsi]|uniref:tetratricopeptide repeat protein n=1 Tax=Sphingomonas jaspsi TaxID=392409 RepID=UPI0004B67D80|nr:tetratricopeptide repeat protein [Sphingomonas jaspsi]